MIAQEGDQKPDTKKVVSTNSTSDYSSESAENWFVQVANFFSGVEGFTKSVTETVTTNTVSAVTDTKTGELKAVEVHTVKTTTTVTLDASKENGISKINQSTSGSVATMPVVKDPKTGKLISTGASLTQDKSTNKQLSANAKISIGLHDEVIKANKDNEVAIKANADKAVEGVSEMGKKIIEHYSH
jgi:hypothetical protein